MIRLKTVIRIVTSICVLTGCVGPDGGPSPGQCEGEMSIELGGGRDVFEARGDGEELMMVHGPQGGWHVETSVRVTNGGDLVQITYDVFDEDLGVQVSANRYNQALVPIDGSPCTFESLALYGYLDVSEIGEGELDTPPELMADHTLRIDFQVSSLDEQTATATQTLQAVLDPIDQ